jgi:hypothetical protein
MLSYFNSNQLAGRHIPRNDVTTVGDCHIEILLGQPILKMTSSQIRGSKDFAAVYKKVTKPGRRRVLKLPHTMTSNH